MGPIWDYNLTYGNVNYCPGSDFKGWIFDFTRKCPNDGFQMPFWWDRLLTDRQFANAARVKYQILRNNTLQTERIQNYIDSVATELTEARTRDFQRWPVIGVYVWPNDFVGQTYQQEIDYLKNWVKNRLSWMDTSIQQFGADVLAVEPAAVFEMTISPNPSSGDVTVQYQLQHRATVNLILTDAAGRTVHSLSLPNQPVGKHNQTLPGRALPAVPGVYYLRIEANGQLVSRKMLRF